MRTISAIRRTRSVAFGLLIALSVASCIPKKKTSTPKSLKHARTVDGADYVDARKDLVKVDASTLRKLAKKTSVSGTLAGVALLIKERPARYQQLTDALAKLVEGQSDQRNPSVLRSFAPDLVDKDAQLVLLEVAMKDEDSGASILVPRATKSRVARNLACDLLLRFADDRTAHGLIETIRADGIPGAEDLLVRIANRRVVELLDEAIADESDPDAKARLQSARDRVAPAVP